jgi:hypothetical protein
MLSIPLVDVGSSDIWSRNGKSATMQDQSQGRTRRVFRLVRALRRVKILRPVLLYYDEKVGWLGGWFRAPDELRAATYIVRRTAL